MGGVAGVMLQEVWGMNTLLALFVKGAQYRKTLFFYFCNLEMHPILDNTPHSAVVTVDQVQVELLDETVQNMYALQICPIIPKIPGMVFMLLLIKIIKLFA